MAKTPKKPAAPKPGKSTTIKPIRAVEAPKAKAKKPEVKAPKVTKPRKPVEVELPPAVETTVPESAIPEANTSPLAVLQPKLAYHFRVLFKNFDGSLLEGAEVAAMQLVGTGQIERMRVDAATPYITTLVFQDDALNGVDDFVTALMHEKNPMFRLAIESMAPDSNVPLRTLELISPTISAVRHSPFNYSNTGWFTHSSTIEVDIEYLGAIRG